MRKNYLIFNINNCIEDYSAVFKFCENIYSTNDKKELPEHMNDKVFVYYGEESDSAEKIFAVSSREMERGALKKYEAVANDVDQKFGGCLRVAHEIDDATIEYIYLAALLYKFPQLLCFLYLEGDEEQKYAVLNKAAEAFCSFAEGDNIYINRIYSEKYNYKDSMWEIEKLTFREADHFKVRPIIKLDESKQEVQFWRKTLKEHRKKMSERVKRIFVRCQKDFIEEFKRRAVKREDYYKSIFNSEQFYDETEDMSLLAFYLFCMQMFYLKGGKLLDEEEIKRIRLNAWDVADGILQIMENIHHSTEKVGFLDIRVHENKMEKSYLSKRYGIDDQKYPFYYEIRLLDLSYENIVESFQKRMSRVAGTEELQVGDFFESRDNDTVDQFWKIYNQEEENLVHHYGLQVFSSIVSANDGIFKVISSSKYQIKKEGETYVNREGWNIENSEMAHLPGTEYIVLLPLRGQEQKFVTSVEVNMEYQYDMETNFIVHDCILNEEQTEARKGYATQEEKERLVNKMASSMYEKLRKIDDKVSPKGEFVALFSAKEWVGYSLEIYCKALILCGIWWKRRYKDKFYCIVNECTENQILEIARLFAVFYCKLYLSEYLGGMQIYLAGEKEEFLITGSNLDSLYAVTSKIMLVKGISKETANIMRYLLGQYGYGEVTKGNEEQVSLVPFDTLELPNTGITLFEKSVMRTLNADIQRHSLGCKINHTHMRIGSKLHIQSFFEAELLFHNNYYISRFASLILKKLPIEKNKKTILVGYETYSELLLYKIVTELMNRKGTDEKEEEILYQASYMIYEQRTGGKFRYMDSDCLKSDQELQFAIIIPINSTLTTHNKVRDALEDELRERGVWDKQSLQIIANYALILIRSSEGDMRDELESGFWEGIKGKRIKTHLIPKGEPDVEFFVCVQTKWHLPLQCTDCFPVKYTDEKPLIETNRASIVPVQMLGMKEPDLIEGKKRKPIENNLERVKALKDSLIYKHIIRNGNHYLYYFCLERYFIQEREGIRQWLIEEKGKRVKVRDRIVYDIIVSPLHYSNAGFLAEVNHYMFDNVALVLNFEVEKEFRENVKTKYSNIIGLYYNLLQMKRKALIRFHFVDDTVVSGKTITRAKTLFQSLIYPVNEDVKIEVFSDIVVILNRMSNDSIISLAGNSIAPNISNQRMEHFHAYVNLNISSMRNHEDACTECKHVTTFTKLRDQSSTNQQYEFWNDRIDRHLPQEIQNKMQEELLNNKDERRERAYRRLLCTHVINERLGELGYKKNDTEQVERVMVELLAEPQKDQIEWIISYVKVFSRPFVSFLKSSREAIFHIMLLMIEYITKELTKRKGIPRQYKEIRIICDYIKTQHQKKDEAVCGLLMVLIKRLSDLGSNYAIRKENIIEILKTIEKLRITENTKKDFRKRYIGVIKSICCQSSDENKSIYFEYLLLFGEEYGKMDEISEKKAFQAENLLLGSSVKEEFADVAFLENTRVLSDGIRDLVKDKEKSYKKDLPQSESIVKLLQEYYYDNFARLLYFYGHWEREKRCLTDQGQELLETLVELNQYLGGEGKKGGKERKEKDAEIYYKDLLQILEKLTGAVKCYFLYRTDMEKIEDEKEAKQYYRIQANKNLEFLNIPTESLGIKRMVADTYVPAFSIEEDTAKLKRSVIKYDIYNEKEITLVNTIFLQLDFPEQFTNRRILIALKMVMIFHNMILQHLKWDFSNNMIQKWSAKEYFNKQVMLQRATDHTDRDNLLKYYNEISNIYKYKDIVDERQLERDKALFHMVINSYIARMNIQILAGVNPERERSKAAFLDVYRSQLRPLIASLHVIEKFSILDENEEEKFSESLLDRKVRLRQTELRESLSYRRISIIIVELILSAINYSRKDKMSYVYIYRDNEYLVVKNQFYSKKGIKRIRQDIKDSIDRKKDGISLATIKGIVNACYGLDAENGVIISADSEERKKHFYVKLPILHIRED